MHVIITEKAAGFPLEVGMLYYGLSPTLLTDLRFKSNKLCECVPLDTSTTAKYPTIPVQNAAIVSCTLQPGAYN